MVWGEQGEGEWSVVIGAQNICRSNEHVGKQGLFREQNFRVWDFVAMIVSSIEKSQGTAEKVLK